MTDKRIGVKKITENYKTKNCYIINCLKSVDYSTILSKFVKICVDLWQYILHSGRHYNLHSGNLKVRQFKELIKMASKIVKIKKCVEFEHKNLKWKIIPSFQRLCPRLGL